MWLSRTSTTPALGLCLLCGYRTRTLHYYRTEPTATTKQDCRRYVVQAGILIWDWVRSALNPVYCLRLPRSAILIARFLVQYPVLYTPVRTNVFALFCRNAPTAYRRRGNIFCRGLGDIHNH